MHFYFVNSREAVMQYIKEGVFILKRPQIKFQSNMII